MKRQILFAVLTMVAGSGGFILVDVLPFTQPGPHPLGLVAAFIFVIGVGLLIGALVEGARAAMRRRRHEEVSNRIIVEDE